MPSTFTVRFVKDWSDGAKSIKKGQKADFPESEAKELVKRGFAITTGVRTSNREKSVMPPLETRDK